MEADMTKLKLGPLTEEKPVRITIDLPGRLHRDLIEYAEALGREAVEPQRIEEADCTHAGTVHCVRQRLLSSAPGIKTTG